jgi:hypothetical protein
MHSWGDKGVDWDGINDAIELIDKRLRTARINIRQSKEKFGTVRVYCSLGWGCLLNITHPGYVSYRKYPKWLVALDIFFLSKFVKLLNVFVVPIHKRVYRNAYKEAVDKYPHLKDEICCAADFVELLDFYKEGK